MRLLAVLFLLISAVPLFAQQPAAPTGLTATAASGKKVNLAWSIPTPSGTPSPTGHHVYRLRAGGTTPLQITVFNEISGTATTFVDDDAALEAGIVYTYTVRAYTGLQENAVLLSNPSNEATATPVASPTAPFNLRSTTITSTSIGLAWGASTGAARYNIYRDDEFLAETTGTTYTDEDLEFSTSYTYVVTAESSTGEESDDSNTLTVSTFGDGSKKAAAFARQFRRVDVNADGQLSEAEYIAVHGARLAWVIAYNRFFYSDKDSSGSLSLTEYAKALGGRKYFAPSKSRQFNLADQDDDGELTVDEYALLKPARAKAAKIEKSYEKLNKEASDGLTPEELKIRNYVSEDEEEL